MIFGSTKRITHCIHFVLFCRLYEVEGKTNNPLRIAECAPTRSHQLDRALELSRTPACLSAYFLVESTAAYAIP